MSDATRILIVDRDPQVAQRLRAEHSDATSPAVFDACTDPCEASAQLTAHTYDAVVMDLEVDDESAADLVGELERRFPGLPLVAIAVRVDDRHLDKASHFGAVAIMAKPFRATELLGVLHQPAPDAGFSGTCCDVPSALLLTLHCAARADGILHLRCSATANRPERIGSIHLEGGQPIHASAGTCVGAQAIHEILGWHDAEATWIPGHARPARTVVGRWDWWGASREPTGLMAHALTAPDADAQADLDQMVAVAYPEVVEKLSRLAQTPDVLGAFLLRHAEVVAGRCVASIDASLAARALSRLAHVHYDCKAQPGEHPDGEIQAMVGSMRLVLDRIGPAPAGFQVGVIVRQAAPVCKSLRRLLRQIDTTFKRAVKRHARRSKSARSPIDLDAEFSDADAVSRVA